LKYQTQLQSWKNDGQAIVAETITNITGTQLQDTRNLTLNATAKMAKLCYDKKFYQSVQLSAGASNPRLT